MRISLLFIIPMCLLSLSFNSLAQENKSAHATIRIKKRTTALLFTCHAYFAGDTINGDTISKEQLLKYPTVSEFDCNMDNGYLDWEMLIKPKVGRTLTIRSSLKYVWNLSQGALDTLGQAQSGSRITLHKFRCTLMDGTIHVLPDFSFIVR